MAPGETWDMLQLDLSLGRGALWTVELLEHCHLPVAAAADAMVWGVSELMRERAAPRVRAV